MKRRIWSGMIVLAIAGCFLVGSADAWGPRANPFLPKISKQWQEVDPLEVYPDFEYNGLTPSCAACPDCDDRFVFFVKGGNTNNLVVYFQGGGACWDTINCLYYPTYYKEVPPLALFSNTTGMGIFDTANPANPFRDWNFVYIPYCTGDIHWGAQDTEYPDTLDMIPGVDSWTIRHRGFVNFQVVLKYMKANFRRPHTIFVTGSSAGSYGAILGFPYIQEAFPKSKVSVLGDAGNGVVTEEFHASDINNWGIQPNLPAWIPGFDRPFSEYSMAEMYKMIADYYPKSKIAQYTNAWDWNQTFFYFVMINIHMPWTWETGWPAVWCEWHDQMMDYVQYAAKARNYRYYIADGDEHTIMMSPRFYTEDSAGVPFIKWVDAMVRDQGGKRGHGGIPWRNVANLDCTDCLPMPDCP